MKIQKKTSMQMENLEDSYPLSPMQQGMLFHSLCAPHSGVYIQQLVCAFHEDLHISAFRQAWGRIVERHAILRTSFLVEDLEVPLQRVHRNVPLPLKEQDWRDISGAEQENRLAAYLRQDQECGFEITEAPLMRLALFRMAKENYRFIWTSHHALLDGRSRLILLKELFALYEAFSQDRDLSLEPSPSYRHYIDWLGKQDFAQAERFWRDRLRGFTAPTPFPIDHTPQVLPGDEEDYGKEEIRLSETLTSTLQSLAQSHRLTLNTLVQGAWAILLSRYSGEEDVAFGATRACRRSALDGAESIVGLFINTLPVRVRVLPGEPLLPWLKKLREQWIALRDHEHTPLLQVQEWSEIPPGEPIFENLLVFENYRLHSLLRSQGGPWKNREFRLLERTNYPLAVGASVDRDLSFKIIYDRRRFDEAAIIRMLGHMKTILEGMAAHPRQLLSELPLMEDAERHQVLIEWNDRKAAYPQDKCIHQLFEEWADRTPEEMAVVFEGQHITYGELNAQANRLAHSLIRQGVGPETTVGICMDRSLDMIVGITGILKAGGAYVPLDPLYPKERLAFMLEDSQALILLTERTLKTVFPDLHIPVLYFDAICGHTIQEMDTNPERALSSENLAYIIYTSGSTGTPKGVMISHRNVVGFLHAYKKVTLDGPRRIGTSVATFSFDTSVEEIFSNLCFGGTLHIIRPENSTNVEYFARYLVDHRITTTYILPDFLSGVAHHLKKMRDWMNLKCVITGLAPKKERVLQSIRDVSDLIRVLNAYGPTEVTYGATAFDFLSATDPDRDVPIGVPFPNYEVYLLDSSGQPVPVGLTGHLLIGGVGLARGYHNRAELTAEMFIPNPFGDEPGARLYRTGDVCRYLPDGNIDFLGRRDHQVKIRGFRIETGEVESVLGQHPAVQKAIVLVREDQAGDKRLVAYLVPKRGVDPTVSTIRGFLKEKIPDYMVPSVFVSLDSLPMTPSGKLDRHALPAPDLSRPELEEAFVPPRTPIEKAVVGIWAEVLGLEHIGVHDNFFELGGHSLLAIQVVSRLGKAFHVKLPLRSFFETPTVEKLSDLIITLERKPGQTERIARILNKIDAMSPEDVKRMLREKRRERDNP
jgi:surfactin family lipopeptide synthetase C